MNEILIPDFARDAAHLAPYLVIVCGALLVMLVDAFVKSMKKDHLSYLTLFVLVLAVVVQIQADGRQHSLLSGMMVVNQFTAFFNYLFFGIGVMTTIFATGIYDREGRYRRSSIP